MIKGIVSSFWRRALGFFLTGVFAVLPLVITAAVVVWVTDILERYVGPATTLGSQVKFLGGNYVSNQTLAYFFGWLIVLVALLALGVLIEFGARKLVKKWIDGLLEKIPLVGSIYSTARQLVNMMDKKGETDLKGMNVVFCVFSKANGNGVLALMPSPEVFRINGRDYHVVIIPTAPVPFGGGLLFMPVENVQPADMSVDGLMSIYVSMGVTTSQFIPEQCVNSNETNVANSPDK